MGISPAILQFPTSLVLWLKIRIVTLCLAVLSHFVEMRCNIFMNTWNCLVEMTEDMDSILWVCKAFYPVPCTFPMTVSHYGAFENVPYWILCTAMDASAVFGIDQPVFPDE